MLVISRLLVLCWGALISLCLAPWRMVRIHILGSSPSAFCCFSLDNSAGFGLFPSGCVDVCCDTWQTQILGSFPAAVLGLFQAPETGLTPTMMAHFWIVGGGLKVFELSDLK